MTGQVHFCILTCFTNQVLQPNRTHSLFPHHFIQQLDGLNVLRVLLCQLLGLLDHFLDGADHVEGLLGQGIVLACEDKHRWH